MWHVTQSCSNVVIDQINCNLKLWTAKETEYDAYFSRKMCLIGSVSSFLFDSLLSWWTLKKSLNKIFIRFLFTEKEQKYEYIFDAFSAPNLILVEPNSTSFQRITILGRFLLTYKCTFAVWILTKHTPKNASDSFFFPFSFHFPSQAKFSKNVSRILRMLHKS